MGVGAVDNSNKVRVRKVKRPLKAVSQEAAKLLSQLREKANRKSFGRPVKEAEIIEFALGLVTAEHLQELQGRTVRHKDRVRMAFEAHKKATGARLSMDEFLSRVIAGEIRPEQPI